MIDALRWHLYRAIDRFGASAVFGVALGLAGAVLTLHAVFVRLPAVEQAEAELQRARQELLRWTPGAEVGEVPHSAKSDSSRTEPLSQRVLSELLWGAARKTQVRIGEVAFDGEDRAGRRDVRATLRAQGGYANVKRFLADVLNGRPNLAVAELQLSRTDGAAAQVEALIVLLVLNPNDEAQGR